MYQTLLMKKHSKNYFELLMLLFLVVTWLLSGSSSAQELEVIEVEIERDSAQLSDLLTGAPSPNPDAASLLDTAMIVTSVANGPAIVRCRAKDDNGAIAGRIRMYIPSGGLRFFLASDIIHERGFVGSVICTSPALVIGSEIMLGVVTSNVEVHQDYRANGSIMLFPVTAMR